MVVRTIVRAGRAAPEWLRLLALDLGHALGSEPSADGVWHELVWCI